MTGPAIKLKAKQMAAWVMEVRLDTYITYHAWIEQHAGRMTKAHETALTMGVRHAFLMQSTFESLMEMYYAGVKPSVAAEKMFRETSSAVRKTKGLAAIYKRASMMSAASYAASPESEAYWAS
jgi:hypothetical protein